MKRTGKKLIPKKFRDDLGMRIIKVRLHRGYTQQELANKLGIHQATFCGWENGHRMPSLMLIPRLARLLRVSCDYILGG
jgi:transcriptional regulator with XRE-family HTH domain